MLPLRLHPGTVATGASNDCQQDVRGGESELVGQRGLLVTGRSGQCGAKYSGWLGFVSSLVLCCRVNDLAADGEGQCGHQRSWPCRVP